MLESSRDKALVRRKLLDSVKIDMLVFDAPNQIEQLCLGQHHVDATACVPAVIILRGPLVSRVAKRTKKPAFKVSAECGGADAADQPILPHHAKLAAKGGNTVESILTSEPGHGKAAGRGGRTARRYPRSEFIIPRSEGSNFQSGDDPAELLLIAYI